MDGFGQEEIPQAGFAAFLLQFLQQRQASVETTVFHRVDVRLVCFLGLALFVRVDVRVHEGEQAGAQVLDLV